MKIFIFFNLNIRHKLPDSITTSSYDLLYHTEVSICFNEINVFTKSNFRFQYLDGRSNSSTASKRNDKIH